MRKLKIVGLALFALVAFSAVAAASASAHTWEEDGSEILTAKEGTTEGLILLEDMGAPGKPDLLCSGKFTGTFGPGGSTMITMIEDLEVPANLEDANTLSWLKCEFTAKGLCEGTLVLVMPQGLPWKDKLNVRVGKLVDEIEGVSYTVLCETFLGTTEDTCSGTSVGEVKNGTSGEVLGETSENEEITPAVNCTLGGEKQGLQATITPALSKLTNGLSLSVS